MGGWARLQCWERQEKHKNTVSGFPLESTFHSATILDEREKKIWREKPRKTVHVCALSPSGLESMGQALLRDEGRGGIFGDICT